MKFYESMQVNVSDTDWIMNSVLNFSIYLGTSFNIQSMSVMSGRTDLSLLCSAWKSSRPCIKENVSGWLFIFSLSFSLLFLLKKTEKETKTLSKSTFARGASNITSYYETDPCLVRFVYGRRLQSAAYLTIGKKNLERRNLTE